MKLVELFEDYIIYEVAGVGTLQQHNTVADIKPGEIQRQAAKFGNYVSPGGEPPNIDDVLKSGFEKTRKKAKKITNPPKKLNE